MKKHIISIILILFAALTVLTGVPVSAEEIPREAIPYNTPQQAVDVAQKLIGATLDKVEDGLGYADAKAETNKIIFKAFLDKQTEGYSYGLLTIIANNAIFEYRDMYLRPEHYQKAEETVRVLLADLITAVENGSLTYMDAKKQAYIKIYQSVNPAFDPDEYYMTDFCYWDIPAVDSAVFNRARKVLLEAEVRYIASTGTV